MRGENAILRGEESPSLDELRYHLLPLERAALDVFERVPGRAWTYANLVTELDYALRFRSPEGAHAAVYRAVNTLTRMGWTEPVEPGANPVFVRLRQELWP